MKITKNVLKRMAILKLWEIANVVVDNQSFTFSQLCLAYGQALRNKYKDENNMIRSINNILGRMIKEGLLIREERGLYKITDKGKRYYINTEHDIIEALGKYLQNMKIIS